MQSPNYFGTRIPFCFSPSFDEIREMAKHYYIIRDVAAHGFYSIILELSPNGKVNTHI